MTEPQKRILVYGLAVIIIIIVTLVAQCAKGATYYVANAPLGNDSRTTTQAQSSSTPWLTLGYSQSQLVAGDTLLLMGGVWKECHGLQDGACATLWLTVSGTNGHPIVFKAQSGTRPIIGSYSADYHNLGIVFDQSGLHDIVIDSLEQKKTMRGISSWLNNSYITIKNCKVDSTAKWDSESNNAGIFTNRDAPPHIGQSYWVVQACSLFNNSESASNLDGTWNSGGIELYDSYHWTIDGNFIFNQHTGVGSIFLKENNNFIEIENNIIHDVTSGIALYNGDKYNSIHNNVLYNGSQAFNIRSSESVNGTTLYNRFYNNTVYNFTNHGATYLAAENGQTVIDSLWSFNNITSECAYGLKVIPTYTPTHYYFDHNDYWHSPSSTVADWLGTNYTLPNLIANVYVDSFSVNIDPVFNNASGHDFHLTDNSPASITTGGRGGLYPTYMGAYAPGDTAAWPVIYQMATDTAWSDSVHIWDNPQGAVGTVDSIIFYWSATRANVVNLTARDSKVSAVSNPCLFRKTGLSYSAKYYFRFASFDVGCFPDTTAIDSTTTSLNISGITKTPGLTTCTIHWQTNEPANWIVFYGHTSSYGSTLGNTGVYQTSYTVQLTGLTPDYVYHLKITSCNVDDNCVDSNDDTFTTSSNTPLGNGKHFIARKPRSNQ
jgi:hypothetical protein